ncbi:PKD domain-containing protein, partial [Acidobacteria bacterium ACD]|nr:PKD domain-containing protein [Acidobacteria bacterium ACD]
MSGTPLNVPAGTAAGDYWLGAIVTVGGSEDSTYVAGKPSNNRFLVGHNPFTTLRVLPGSGGTAVVADFSFAPASPQAGQAVTFTDLSRGSPTSWSWKFGDGGTSTSKNPDHVYASAGTYTVTLTASSAGSSNAASRTVAVVPKPGTGTSSVASTVPIVLDLPGRFSSELTLTNSGTSTATIRLRYT